MLDGFNTGESLESDPFARHCYSGISGQSVYEDGE